MLSKYIFVEVTRRCWPVSVDLVTSALFDRIEPENIPPLQENILFQGLSLRLSKHHCPISSPANTQLETRDCIFINPSHEP